MNISLVHTTKKQANKQKQQQKTPNKTPHFTGKAGGRRIGQDIKILSDKLCDTACSMQKALKYLLYQKAQEILL